MKLLFLRHGEAGTAACDDDRALTPRGCDDIARVAIARRAVLASVSQVLVSPILRAQQTADITCRQAGLVVPRRTVDWLVHETPVQVALKALSAQEESTLLIGHQPLAGSLIQKLTGEFLSVGTANLVEMEGDALLPGFMIVTHHETP